MTQSLPVISKTHRVQSSTDADVCLNLRERRPAGPRLPDAPPLLLVHGATIASVLWDNPMPGWSWMDRLALDGVHCFALDLRGYGGSSRPDSFQQPALQNPPYARAADVLGDVIDAIDAIRTLTGAAQVDLLGGSWGSMICGQLVAQNPALPIRRLILYAPLYCEPDSKPVWLTLPDDRDAGTAPAQQIDLGAYRMVSEADLRLRWDEEIPVADKSTWRPDGVLEALAGFCIEEDHRLGGTSADRFRVPNGTILDLQEIYLGRPLYDCAQISIPTLLLRGDADPTSTHADASRLYQGLSADIKRYTVVGNGAHFMVGEQKLSQVHAVVCGFLSEEF